MVFQDDRVITSIRAVFLRSSRHSLEQQRLLRRVQGHDARPASTSRPGTGRSISSRRPRPMTATTGADIWQAPEQDEIGSNRSVASASPVPMEDVEDDGIAPGADGHVHHQLREQPLPVEDEPLLAASYPHWTQPGHVEAQLPSGAASFSAPRRRQTRVSCVGSKGGNKTVARIFGSPCAQRALRPLSLFVEPLPRKAQDASRLDALAHGNRRGQRIRAPAEDG